MSYVNTKTMNALAVVKWIAAGIASFWASLSVTIHVLVILMALDFVTGLTAAFVRKSINADISFKGLAKKLMMFVMIYAGHLISVPLRAGFDIGEILALAFLVNEAISITENCAAVGIPIPPFLMQTLAKARSLVASSPDTVVVTTIQTETVTIPPAKKSVTETVITTAKKPEPPK